MTCKLPSIGVRWFFYYYPSREWVLERMLLNWSPQDEHRVLPKRGVTLYFSVSRGASNPRRELDDNMERFTSILEATEAMHVLVAEAPESVIWFRVDFSGTIRERYCTNPA